MLFRDGKVNLLPSVMGGRFYRAGAKEGMSWVSYTEIGITVSAALSKLRCEVWPSRVNYTHAR